MSDPFNCPKCGAHDWGLNAPHCPHCGYGTAAPSSEKLESDTPETDAYEAEYREWCKYAEQYKHLPEAMDQCPLEDDPIGMMRRFERRLRAARSARSESERSK